MYKFCPIAIAVLLMPIKLISSFQPSTSSTHKHQDHIIIRQQCHYKSPVTLYQSTQEEDEEEEYELVEFFVSPNQIEILRKEANKRKMKNYYESIMYSSTVSSTIASYSRYLLFTYWKVDQPRLVIYNGG